MPSPHSRAVASAICRVALMSLGRGSSGRPGREAKTARIGCAPSTYVLSGWGQVGNLHFSAPGRRGRGKPPRAAWAYSVGSTRPAPQRTGLFSKFLGFSFLPFLPPAKRTKSWRKSEIFLWEAGSAAGDGFAPDCSLSQPVVVNPAIWWMPQEVPHSRPYSGRNRTGEGAGAVRFALDRLVISARPIPVRFGVEDRVS